MPSPTATLAGNPPRPGEARDDDKGYWTLEKCKRAYMDYLDSKRAEIDEQQLARRYRHADQWESGQVAVFNLRRQPVVTYNRIGRKIDSIVGLMERLKQDAKAFPRSPSPREDLGAELATMTIRYVVDSELRKHKFPFIVEAAATDGVAGVEMILTKGDKGDADIGFAKVNNDGFFYDPNSIEHDFSDAGYMGYGKWLDIEDAREIAGDKADEIEASGNAGLDMTTNSDREKRWFDSSGDRKRVRVVDIWYKHNGGWCWALFTGSTKLHEGRGYFYDEKGKEICKYIMFSAFVDHEGDRYGFVRNLKSSQDEINQRRSKGLHELMSRRIKAEDGAFQDVEVARREAVRPDGVVIYSKGFEMEFDDAARIANVEGQLKFLEDAKNEIENFGPNPALIGQGLEYKSGRAINLLQQSGIAELGPFVIGLKEWKLRLYRAIWCAIQRYWTAERWIRVTDDDGAAQLVQLNALQLDPVTQLPKMVNAIGQLDVDIILEEGPDEVNIMADAYDTLLALAQQGARIPPEILLELSPLPASQKRKLLGILGQKDPANEQAKQIALASEIEKLHETQSRTELNMAKAEETRQGGAHGTVERVMDAQMKEREFQMKQAGEETKLMTERERANLQLRGEISKLRAEQQRQAIKTRAQMVQAHLQRQNMAQRGGGNAPQGR